MQSSVRLASPDLRVLAFSKVLKRVPEAQLVMIRDGPLRPTVEGLISALLLADRVRLLGAEDHAHLDELMGVPQCSCNTPLLLRVEIVAPSGDREGTPVAILEASAAAVPVVATRHEGIADVVIDAETGFLVEEGDVAGMAAAVADLLLDPKRAQLLGQAARRPVEEKYSMQASIDGLWAILERAFDR
jgi:colanic acid/amylovoran biosynthesis glycosyltransferase